MASKQVTFRYIQLEGFKSYSQPVKFTFANTGLHLIKGLNGGGKTSLFSALTWALYKTNLNDTNNTKIPTFKHKRTKGYKGTRVQVLMGIGKYKYLIARHIDFKGKTAGIEGADALLIFKKEKSDKTPFEPKDIVNDKLYKDDQQAYLNMILGIDAKTFLSSVIFGQRMDRLMDSKDADKRDLFERLFDVGFIDDLKDKAATRIADTNTILTQVQSDLAIAVVKRDTLTQQIEDANTILEDFAINRKKALSIIKKDHTVAKLDIELIGKEIELATKMLAKSGKSDNLAILAEAQNQASDAYYNSKQKLAVVQRDIDENIRRASNVSQRHKEAKTALNDITTNCPTCGAPIAAGKLSAAKAAINTQIEELNMDVQSCNQRGDKLSKQEDILLDMVKKTQATYEKALDANTTAKQQTNSSINGADSLAVLQERKKNKLQYIKQLVAAYNREKEKEPPAIDTAKYEAELAAVEAKIPTLEKAIKANGNLIVRLNWWYKSFGANGLRSFVFSSQLNTLNSCVGVYAAYFGLSITFGIDLTKASKPFFCRVTLDGKNEVDYDSLSGGEKQRADLSMCFGLQDASEMITSFNISVMDEPEGNLDVEVLEILDMLIRIRAEKKSVYVISHNNQMDLSGATIFTVSGGKSGTSAIN